MKFFTKQSSKTVAKRFAFLFLTMLAFGFTANAQIPTFNEILERYYNPQDLVVKATAQTQNVISAPETQFFRRGIPAGE